MKQRILCTLLFALSINSFSQAVIGKQKTIGGNADDEMGSFWLTKDGGMILGGRSYSGISGEKTDYNRGIDDYWVVKKNSNGNIQWQRTFGGSDIDEMTSIQQTKDGGYILAGNSQSGISGDKTEASKGVFDCWVIKLDKYGNIQWQKSLGGDSYEFCNSVQQTSDGGYILGCMSVSNISGDKSENSKGGYDFWIVKLDGNGNKQWDKTLGGSGDEFANQAIQTADGGYLAVGLSNSNISGDKTENSRGSNDYWAVKLDKNGNKQWDKTAGGSGDDYVNGVVQTPNGNYYLTGSSVSGISGDKTEASRGGFDYWLVQLNKSGSILFNKTMGGSSDEYEARPQTTADSGLIIGGQSLSSASGEKTENSRGGFDYWVIKLDARNHIMWDKTAGGSGDDFMRAIREAKKDNYVLGGDSWSNISGDKDENSRGGLDYWTVNISSTSPENEAVNTTENITVQQNTGNKIFMVYPNPAKDVIHIQLSGKAGFTLADQYGKIILTQTIDGAGTINTAHIAAGNYYLKNNETGITKKIIIIK